MSLTEPHNEFLELCAISTSGQLTEKEQMRVQEHLPVCQSCRETLKQYESVVDQAIPVFVAKEASKGLDAGQDWSEDQQRQAELLQTPEARAEEVHKHKRSIHSPRSTSPIFQ